MMYRSMKYMMHQIMKMKTTKTMEKYVNEEIGEAFLTFNKLTIFRIPQYYIQHVDIDFLI